MPAGITPLPPDAKHTRARARRPALDLSCDSAVIPRETRNARGTQGSRQRAGCARPRWPGFGRLLRSHIATTSWGPAWR
jgi:hypothetical protein